MMTPQEDKENQIILDLAHKDFRKGLSQHAFYRIHDKTTSEDLVQDTFMKTWRYLLKGGKIETMKAFLYHVLNDLIVDQYRKHKTTSLDKLIEKGFEPSSNDSNNIYNFLDGKKTILLIERLPEKYKTVITMKYVDDLTIEEMSKNTSQTKNTIAVQIHRGLSKLKILYNSNKKGKK